MRASLLYSGAAGGEPLSNGSELNTQIQTFPANTLFRLKSGQTYRLTTPIIPKAGMRFLGDATNPPILNGSKIIASGGFTNVSGVYHASLTTFSQSPTLGGTGQCLSGRRCNYPNDCYVDGTLYTNVALQASVTAATNTFFIDYTTNPPTLYIGQNPSGKTVEVCFTQYCFDASNASAGSSVWIKDIIIEKFANQAQSGALGGGTTAIGTGWRSYNVESRLNHGQGIRLGDSHYCTASKFHHNGQTGYSGGGTSLTLNNSEINNNNTAGFVWGWEAGGGKFAGTTSSTVSNCIVHDNSGPGIWWDIDNYLTTTDRNTAYNNVGPGIMYEISYDGTISNNICYDNSPGSNADAWGVGPCQIFISTSQNVEIHHNTVVGGQNGCLNGITMVQQDRSASGPAARGAYVTTGNNFHHNDVKVIGSVAWVFLFGSDFGSDPVGSTLMDNNAYHMPNTAVQFFSWNASKTLTTWRSSFGFDTNSTQDTNQTAYP